MQPRYDAVCCRYIYNTVTVKCLMDIFRIHIIAQISTASSIFDIFHFNEWTPTVCTFDLRALHGCQENTVIGAVPKKSAHRVGSQVAHPVL